MRAKRKLDADTFHAEGEFLWLVSLSDLMILLFVFFVVMFSYSFKEVSLEGPEAMLRVLTKKNGEALNDIQTRLHQWAVDKNLLDSVDLTRKSDGLILQLREKVLFNQGESMVREDSSVLLEAMARALERIPSPYRIGIEGHTDDVPMRTGANNWELSAQRAMNVMKILKLNEETLKRTVVMGYGEMQPLFPNRDDRGAAIIENQQKNRRVTIRIF